MVLQDRRVFKVRTGRRGPRPSYARWKRNNRHCERTATDGVNGRMVLQEKTAGRCKRRRRRCRRCDRLAAVETSEVRLYG
jgi:hypothetical protein